MNYKTIYNFIKYMYIWYTQDNIIYNRKNNNQSILTISKVIKIIY